MRVPTPALALGLAIAAAAAPAAVTVSSRTPVTVVVDTAGHDFAPQVIDLPGGRPVRLLIRNPSGIDHDFYAPAFFETARIDDADRGMLRDDRVEIPKYSSRAIRLIARPGHYDLKSTKPLDVVSGMQGQILVH